MGQILSNIRKVHKRTECACEGCVACCKFMPGMVGVEDLYIILNREEEAAKERSDKEWFGWHNNRTQMAITFVEEHFQASQGAVVQRQGEDPVRIPTLVPKLTEKGCVFLDENDRCKIWEYAPVGCALFDSHMTMAEADPISLFALGTVRLAWEENDWYAKFWGWLDEQGIVPPPLEERRGKMEEAFKRIEEKDGNTRTCVSN